MISLPLLSQDSLGRSITAIARVVPDGLLVFFSSYSMMDRLQERWKVSAAHLPYSSPCPCSAAGAGMGLQQCRHQDCMRQDLAVACYSGCVAPLHAIGIILLLHQKGIRVQALRVLQRQWRLIKTWHNVHHRSKTNANFIAPVQATSKWLAGMTSENPGLRATLHMQTLDHISTAEHQ